MTKILTPILLSLNLFLMHIAFGQPSWKTEFSDYSRLNEVLPPSPGAAALGKFGGINFGLSSGAMNHNVPLTNFTSANINVPISLSYSTTGFKVDEVATRVGTSWNLNAGGVITRIVRGAIDERSKRLIPPGDFPKRTRNLINFMEGIVTSNENGPNDAEHDIFSFNFLNYSGQFILDANKNPVLFSHSAIKIEKNFLSGDYNFLFTAPDGVRYYFGGQGATETTSKSAFGAGCGKPFRDAIPTAWYLNKIIHPNHDTVYFKYIKTHYDYKAGISQTLFSNPINAVPGCPGGSSVSCRQIQSTTCVSEYLIEGVLLKEMASNSGGKIKFQFTSRNDGLDSLLSRIAIYKPQSNQIFKAFDFEYLNVVATKYLNNFSADLHLVNRPFLVKLIERAPGTPDNKTYEFSYEDLDNLPPRLAFAQDHYGYFNGKPNKSLIPKPSDPTWETYFLVASANREADPAFSQKGLLKKIKHPTGGEDNIVYGGHTVYRKVISMPPDTTVAVYGQGSRNIQQVAASDLIVIKRKTDAKLQMSFSYDEIVGGGFDSKHHIATVNLIDENSGKFIYQNTLTREAPDADFFLRLLPGIYRITIEIRGSGSFCGTQLIYKPGNPIESYQNVYVGGIRVEKVITRDNGQGKEIVKKYLYNSLARPGQSSGSVVNTPIYEHYFGTVVSCTVQSTGNNKETYPCMVGGCSYYSLYSNSQNNLFIYPGSPVYYHAVVESFGESFENGGKEYHFLVDEDVPGNSLLGEDIVGAPYSNYSWNNGKETLQYSFRKKGSAIVPVQKVFTSYKIDPRRDKEFTSYIASKKYTPECTGADPPDITELNTYYLMSYSHFQKWIYVDTVKTLTYDLEGQHFIAHVDVTEFGNPDHALPTKQASFGSDGKEALIKNFYPQDLALSGAEELTRLKLISKNILSPVLEQYFLKGGNFISKSKASFSVFPNGLVLPRSYYTQMVNGPVEKRVNFFKYNTKGKLLEQAKEGDLPIAYLWGYQGAYPIAEVKNAQAKDIFHTSFEDAEGNSVGKDGRTGHKSKTDGYVKALSSLTNGLYRLSYWQKSGNTWSYQASLVKIDKGTYTIRLVGQVDEVRLHPSDAQMTTYTYDPLVGMTSATDANGQTKYYEYDGFGRLALVRDQDGNILSSYCYNYAGQLTDCGNLFRSASKSQTFTRNDCPSGQTGSPVLYSVTAGRYTSNASQADADAKAQADIDANGQAYANRVGTCRQPLAKIDYNNKSAATLTVSFSPAAGGESYSFDLQPDFKGSWEMESGTYHVTITPPASSNHLTYNYGVNGHYQQGNGNSAVTFNNVRINRGNPNNLDVSGY